MAALPLACESANREIEHDGARIITNSFCEFIQPVPRDTNQVFGVFTESSPGSILLDAVTQLEAQSPKADDYIQLIRPNLTEAVDTCVSTSGMTIGHGLLLTVTDV